MAASRRRILLCCFEVAGYGGAATSTYALFRRMSRDGEDVHLMQIVDAADAAFFAYQFGESWDNRDRLPNVGVVVLSGPLFAPHPELADGLAAVRPDVVLADGFIAAALVAATKPTVPLVFYTAGSRQAQEDILNGMAPDALSLLAGYRAGRHAPTRLLGPPRDAVRGATLVVTHSPLIRELLEVHYPAEGNKVYREPVWRADWILDAPQRARHRARPFAQRGRDVLFVASDWRRFEKNFGLLVRIVGLLPDRRVHIVGPCPEPIPKAVLHGFVADRDELFALMGDSKCVVSPSRLDAAPGVLWEAAALGCNVVASRNCGNWGLCPDDLLVEDYSAEGFAAAIRLATDRPRPARMDRFSGGYETLTEILDVV